MESLIGFLPFLILLACPLMMVFCFWGMRRMGCENDMAPAEAEPVAVSIDQDLPLPARIALLQDRLNQLQTEQNDIAAQLAELAWTQAAQDVSDQAPDKADSAAPKAATIQS